MNWNSNLKSLSGMALLLLCFAMLFSKEVLACASCSSGSGSPLVLYPNEQSKVYFGSSQLMNIGLVQANGRKVSRSNQLARKETQFYAAGLKPLSQVSVVVGQGLIRNVARDGRARSDYGDPIFELRYTALEGNWLIPERPQVQGILILKPSMATSIYEQEDPEGLDVFGNGFDETTIGADFWWNMLPLKPGFAMQLVQSSPKTIDSAQIERGTRGTLVVGIGHAFQDYLNLALGFKVEMKGKDAYEGQRIVGSQSRQDDFFASLRWNLNQVHEIRAVFSEQGFSKTSKNAVRAQSAGLSYARAI
jgi:hypothetical protein